MDTRVHLRLKCVHTRVNGPLTTNNFFVDEQAASMRFYLVLSASLVVNIHLVFYMRPAKHSQKVPFNGPSERPHPSVVERGSNIRT